MDVRGDLGEDAGEDVRLDREEDDVAAREDVGVGRAGGGAQGAPARETLGVAAVAARDGVVRGDLAGDESARERFRQTAPAPTNPTVGDDAPSASAPDEDDDEARGAVDTARARREDARDD